MSVEDLANHHRFLESHCISQVGYCFTGKCSQTAWQTEGTGHGGYGAAAAAASRPGKGFYVGGHHHTAEQGRVLASRARRTGRPAQHSLVIVLILREPAVIRESFGTVGESGLPRLPAWREAGSESLLLRQLMQDKRQNRSKPAGYRATVTARTRFA